VTVLRMVLLIADRGASIDVYAEAILEPLRVRRADSSRPAPHSTISWVCGVWIILARDLLVRRCTLAELDASLLSVDDSAIASTVRSAPLWRARMARVCRSTPSRRSCAVELADATVFAASACGAFGIVRAADGEDAGHAARFRRTDLQASPGIEMAGQKPGRVSDDVCEGETSLTCLSGRLGLPGISTPANRVNALLPRRHGRRDGVRLPGRRGHRPAAPSRPSGLAVTGACIRPGAFPEPRGACGFLHSRA